MHKSAVQSIMISTYFIMNSILCPHCGKQVEISQALAHQLREKVREEEAARHKAELEKTKLEAEERALKRAKEEIELSLKNSKEEVEEKNKQYKDLQEQFLTLTKELRDLRQKDDEREVEMQKKLLKEQERMELEIAKTIQEKIGLEKAELQKQLEDTKKALEEAQRKAAQKSQQLQGEVLELDLETQLRDLFTTDEITPVPKGIEGADLLQKVKNKFGNVAGIIIWETKRTKAWSNSWPSKLREDKRKIDANIAVLVTDALPEGITTFGFYENIWVTCYKYAIPLVNVLRISLFELAIAKSTTAHKDTKLEELFQYLAKDGFRNKFEAQVESIISLHTDLETERRSTVRMWKKREMQIKRLMANLATMYGELQGIMGNALPSIQSLDSPMLLEESKQENLLD